MCRSTYARRAARVQRGKCLSELTILTSLLLLASGIVLGPTFAGAAEEPKEVTNSMGMKLLLIPAGEFVMGRSEEGIEKAKRSEEARISKEWENDPESRDAHVKARVELLDSCGPEHRVRISRPFFLGACEITQQEFANVMGYNPSAFSAGGRKGDRVTGLDTSRFPVERVSWDDAVEFCRQLSALPEEMAAGRTYRLPTEAQWEYACRAGTATTFFWGENAGIKGGLAREFIWFKGNSEGHPHPVGEKKPNPWGLYDMTGNMGEWCADWFAPKAYANSPSVDPTGPVEGVERVRRPSCYAWDPSPVTNREKAPPDFIKSTVGFRVACDIRPPAVQAVPVVESTPAHEDAEVRLKSKGLVRQGRFFVLAEDVQFARFASALERLRVACLNARKECQEVKQHLARARTAKATAVTSRMAARTSLNYSDSWRDHWASVRARNNASDAALLVDLSLEGLEKWRRDAQTDYDTARELYGRQCQTLRQMFGKLKTQYAELADNADVKWGLTEVNNTGKGKFKLGPSSDALAAAKKLEREETLLAQFMKL